jgi:bifunctional non-homologous end joining protein LigD
MATVQWRSDMRTVRPMLATLEDAPLEVDGLVYEPKYDGIRALVEILPGRQPSVRLWSRLGNEKTAQFPDLVAALVRFAKTLKKPLVLDGEIVALDEHGDPAGFQRLQNRIHLTESHSRSAAGRVAFIAFDILRDGDEDVRPLPFTARRSRLERVFPPSPGLRRGSPILRRSDVVHDDARALYRQALERGWEGLIAKDSQSVYHTGKRTRDWRKLKLVKEQEFVVGGWTEARTTGRPFGALLVGYYDEGALQYAGHTGSGFNQRELERVIRLLKPLETSAPPFSTRPRTNERAHWTKPSLVAQLKFTEWTDDGMLRHPIYLGMRDDVKAETVRRESPGSPKSPGSLKSPTSLKSPKSRTSPESRKSPKSRKSLTSTRGFKTSGKRVAPGGAAPATPAGPSPVHVNFGPRTGRGSPATGPAFPDYETASRALIDQLDEIERGKGSGTLQLPDGQALAVTNLRKIFWPTSKLTKGDLMRYYVRVAPFILPVVNDRPLIMKRLPNGIEGPSFYQHRAPDHAPAGVRLVSIEGDDVPSRIVGGTLLTLLYMTQLAAISQDPWFSRVQSLQMASHCAIDLDPMPGVTFESVLDVARWVRDELVKLNVTGYPKTSGASGVHIYIPLRDGTPYEAGQIFCQIVATYVADKHPKVATVTRAVRARGRKVYVDYLQNIEGKSLACAYSARASDFAGASTPLTWDEIDEGVDPRDFTIRTLPDRLARVGDLWAPLLRSKGVDLRRIVK